MRLTQDQRDRIDQAAEYKGLSSSQWALSNLLDAAERDIRSSHTIQLDDEAWESFASALDGPMPEQTLELIGRKPIWQ
ncbi:MULTISPECIES: DUF1778 domain-containing protein [Bifidobacterium]|uniref:type II toxin-antitoxin system TacA family antitoxin n=1 Tax=Bifidobacterium TaxID=1678 RepID=UPI001F0B1623|nr:MULTISPECIES: DUF1778 domain-containing protein [Bifidobacterium]